MLCSNDSLLKFLASFKGHREILWMFQGFLEVRKTVSELTCEHLRVLNIFQPHNAHIYVCCTVILQLPCDLYDVCDFASNLVASDHRRHTM